MNYPQIILTGAAIWATLLCSPARAADDLLIADFEGPDYGSWQATGEAFGAGPANRDPKVIWYAPEKKWVMALFLNNNDYELLSSKDLKQWERMSKVTIPDCGECPEFFEIAVDGNKPDTRWIFYGGNGRYLVGKFDGKTFTQESGPHSLHSGNAWYASQTFNDIPAEDGRRILIAWGQVELPGMPFNQMMGAPVALTLRTTADALRLHA